MMKKFTFDIKWILIAGIIGFLLVFQVFPLVYLLFRAFFATGHFSLESFARIYSYALNWTCLKNTLFTALLSMVFGVLIAFPLAWLVGRTNLHGRRVFRTLFVMTYMVPPYVGAMAWLRLLNPSVGTLNVFLQKIFGLAGMPFNIYTTGGLVWVLTTFYYPYAFITISRAMEKMDPSLEEASRISGASPLKTLFTVTIPLMLPSIAAAGLLVFVAAASCYGIPSIIGAPGKIYTVTTRIVDYVYVGSQQGLTDATVLAVFLMLLAMVILYVSDYRIYPWPGRCRAEPWPFERPRCDPSLRNGLYDLFYCQHGEIPFCGGKYDDQILGDHFFPQVHHKVLPEQCLFGTLGGDPGHDRLRDHGLSAEADQCKGKGGS